jgi:predicted Holliday junction resolvase-like endonuclease
MITTIIILILIIFILGYISYNLFKKVEILEAIVDSQEQYISGVSKAINYADKRLEEIDEKGSFKSDDEIGWFFESVQTLQRELNNFNLNGRTK